MALNSKIVAENTFEKVARDWHRLILKKWQPQAAENIRRRFEVDQFPAFGSVPIADVKVPHVLAAAIRTVEKRSALEVAKRLTSDCSRVFKYAIRAELTEKIRLRCWVKFWSRGNRATLPRLDLTTYPNF